MRLLLDYHRDHEGRLVGEASWHGAAAPVAFSGTLELLRILEDREPAQAASDGVGPVGI